MERVTAACEKSVDSLASYLEPRGIERDAAIGARLGHVCEVDDSLASLVGSRESAERFVGMMSIPYVTPAGPMALKFRCLGDHEDDCKAAGHPKYDSPPSQHPRLYNVRAFQMASDIIAICEGELDALVCTSAVGVPAVGVPGTAWMDHWPRCFADHAEVLIVVDNDDNVDPQGKRSNPGLKHAKAIHKTLPNARLVLPPLGMDLGEWVLDAGTDTVRRAMGL